MIDIILSYRRVVLNNKIVWIEEKMVPFSFEEKTKEVNYD